MKRKRKFTFLTIGMLCLWPIIVAAKNTAQKQNNEKSDSDNLAQNITLVLKTVQEAKGLAKNTKKESVEWRKQINKTTKTAEEMTEKLSDSARNLSDGIDTLKYESREWRKESKKMRKEMAMLREDLTGQINKLVKSTVQRGTGGILVIAGLIGLYFSLSSEKYKITTSGVLAGLTVIGGGVLLY